MPHSPESENRGDQDEPKAPVPQDDIDLMRADDDGLAMPSDSTGVATQAPSPVDLDGLVAELVAVESMLEQTRRRLVRVTDTLGGIARVQGVRT